MSGLLKWIIASTILLMLAGSAHAGWAGFQDSNPNSTPFTPAWQALSIGGGGEMNSLSIASSDGTILSATNTYGAYLYKTSGSCAGADSGGWGTTRAAPCWEQLFTQTSAPLTLVQIHNELQAVNDIIVCNSNTNDAYAWYNKTVYSTQNLKAAASSRSWNATTFTTTLAGNAGFNTWHTLACDPANPNVVYASNQSGVSASGNGLAGTPTFSAISGIGSVGAVADVVAFDGTASSPTQACTQYSGSPTCTKHLMILVLSTGAFESYNGGSSFTATSGGPTSGAGTPCEGPTGHCNELKADKFGNFYAVVGDGKIWKYVPNGSAGGGTWSALTPSIGSGNPTAVFALDPSSGSVGALRMAAAYSDGNISISTNGGSTWCTSVAVIPFAASGAQPPWFGNANQGQGPAVSDYLAAKDLEFDPSGNLWLNAGIGIWEIVSASVGCNATWQANSVGIENLVINHIDGPPGDGVIVAAWDRAFWSALNPDVFPTHYWPDISYSTSLSAIIAGWGLDWASSNSSTLTGFAAFQSTASASSSDGGNTLALWSNQITWNGTDGGGVAASSPTNWISTNGGSGTSILKYTLNGATTAWLTPTITGVGNITPAFGVGFSLAADRVTASAFCLYDSNTAVFSSTDGGANWTKVINAAAMNTGFYNHALKAVPGQAGTFYLSGGNQGGGVTTYQLYKITKTTTECDTATLVNANFTDIYGMGFGAAKPGGNGFPTIYYWGANNGVYGLWEIDNGGTTASLINVPASQQTWPNNSSDFIADVSGDMNVYGRVYVGHHGSGATYIDKADACPWVNFSNTKPNAALTGTVTLSAQHSGLVPVASVSFYVDGALIGTQTTGTGTPTTYSQNWVTGGVAPGAHTLKVQTTGNGCSASGNSFSIPVTTS